MQKRTLKVVVLSVLTTFLVLGFAGVALAAPTWSDLPESVTTKYGITDSQIKGISAGYGTLWKPSQVINRAQFTKMAVTAFDVELANWTIASFRDVPKTSIYYQWIEGARAAGLVNGITLATFGPTVDITRVQAVAIISRYIAKTNGYDLATMYTPAEIDALLANFGDKASISSDLKAEVAFAYDFGITEGDAKGNMAPATKLTRIQAAAFLIRAQGKVPTAGSTPAKIQLVSADKSENLIGVFREVTFKVTDAAGEPAAGVLVDFDTIFADPFYVGNISPQAAMTNNFGEVKVKLISAEPGTQRMSAAVKGLAATYATAYWLALDEVYTVGSTLSAQNNVGVAHEWGVRVVVFGPGPRSTAQTDWYNAISTAAFDPTSLKQNDGVDFGDYWSYDYELDVTTWTAADSDYWDMDIPPGSYKPRTMAGISVEWSIYNILDDPGTSTVNEAYTSVGNITAVDGVAITAAKTATGKTDANGYSKIKIESTVTGKTYTRAIATYVGNPYPKMLVDHDTIAGDAYHDYDWDPQPAWGYVDVSTDDEDLALCPGSPAAEDLDLAHLAARSYPIIPAYVAPNIGEERTLVITLVDTKGNPVAGREVEWTMQGVGFFQTDDSRDVSDQEGQGSKDYDVTDSAGKATVFVKSYEPGEQIVHAKVRDKGTGGAEGTYQMYTAEVQWLDANVVTFDDPTTTQQMVFDRVSTPADDGYPNDILKAVPVNEAVSSNVVGATHIFTLHAYGLKLELDPTPNDPTKQTPYIDGDMAGSAYDGIFDAKDAAYLGGILLVNATNLHVHTTLDSANLDVSDYQPDILVDAGGKILRSWDCDTVWVQGRQITLSYVGGYTKFDVNGDGVLEEFSGRTGIYLPLKDKTVSFDKVDSVYPYPAMPSVGSITTPVASVLTNAAGEASVTINSNVKGPERIKATLTWQGNPHGVLNAWAQKAWVAGKTITPGDLKFSVWVDGRKVADNAGAIVDPVTHTYDVFVSPYTGLELGSTHVEVHVQDLFGNDLADYEVVYLLNSIGQVIADDTYVPLAYLTDGDPTDLLPEGDPTGAYDQNGPRPDSNEPRQTDDPFAYIVGPGGTESFFFNQWLGSSSSSLTGEAPYWARTDVGQPGVPSWPLGRSFGSDFSDYNMSYNDYLDLQSALGTISPLDKDIWGFDGLIGNEYNPPNDIGLATDGAKAWTLDSFYTPTPGLASNLLTGSRVDIQLADENIEGPNAKPRIESILRVMIYAPADGLVLEGAPIYSTQVHVLWGYVPVLTSIKLTPDKQVKIAGTVGPASAGEQATVTVQFLDQFGNPVPNLPLGTWLNVLKLEGTPLDPPTWPSNADATGKVTLTWAQANTTWGVQQLRVSTGTITSNKVLVDWALDDSSHTYVAAAVNTGTLILKNSPTFTAWDGKIATGHLNPARRRYRHRHLQCHCARRSHACEHHVGCDPGSAVLRELRRNQHRQRSELGLREDTIGASAEPMRRYWPILRGARRKVGPFLMRCGAAGRAE